jgi:hypothetical protein
MGAEEMELSFEKFPNVGMSKVILNCIVSVF